LTPTPLDLGVGHHRLGLGQFGGRSGGGHRLGAAKQAMERENVGGSVIDVGMPSGKLT